MVFFGPRLACPMLDVMLSFIPPMKISRFSHSAPMVTRLVCTVTCLFPSLLLAHPGHYHPDETDEFDFMRATFLHTHGSLEWVLMGVVIASIGIVVFGRRPAFRIGALAMGLASLSLFPIL